ncbi:farnesyl-diphosphate farnesyltransferase [Xylariales sp. PMI_506]|nr:farnesyl-diphosphate farnesyltransferase [Xylariales sp. PMI_506]
MSVGSNLIYFTFHPNQLRLLLQWRLWRSPVHKRDTKSESQSTKTCFNFLDQTGRSYSAVIQELHPDLLMPVCVFYLVLRGLDTIEDDTSIPLNIKEPMLRKFKHFLEQDGWTFNGNRPEEKDRELLVQFDNVIAEFKAMKPSYQAVIKDVANTMGNGMADYVRRAASGDISIETVNEYNLYCWYVAGVVGDGLTRLFIEARLVAPSLINQPHLYKSMGLLLQKNNIIRDIHEDYVDGRCFWPKEIWSKYVDSFEDLFKPENIIAALNCNSDMVLNALEHTRDCLSYLGTLREQSVFNFCAIPQVMALATLDLCFRNPALFQRNLKITKGDAIQLMCDSSENMHSVCNVFRRYIRRIYHKNSPEDPNYSRINDTCTKLDAHIEALLQNLGGADRTIDGKSLASNSSIIWLFSCIMLAVLSVALSSALGMGIHSLAGTLLPS